MAKAIESSPASCLLVDASIASEGELLMMVQPDLNDQLVLLKAQQFRLQKLQERFKQIALKMTTLGMWLSTLNFSPEEALALLELFWSQGITKVQELTFHSDAFGFFERVGLREEQTLRFQGWVRRRGIFSRILLINRCNK